MDWPPALPIEPPDDPELDELLLDLARCLGLACRVLWCFMVEPLPELMPPPELPDMDPPDWPEPLDIEPPPEPDPLLPPVCAPAAVAIAAQATDMARMVMCFMMFLSLT